MDESDRPHASVEPLDSSDARLVLLRRLRVLERIPIDPRTLLEVERLFRARDLEGSRSPGSSTGPSPGPSTSPSWKARNQAASLAALLATDRTSYGRIHRRICQLLEIPADPSRERDDVARQATQEQSPSAASPDEPATGSEPPELPADPDTSIEPERPDVALFHPIAPDDAARPPLHRRVFEALSRGTRQVRNGLVVRARRPGARVWLLVAAAVVLLPLIPVSTPAPRPPPPPPVEERPAPRVSEPPDTPDTSEDSQVQISVHRESAWLSATTRTLASGWSSSSWPWLVLAFVCLFGAAFLVVGISWLLAPRRVRKERRRAEEDAALQLDHHGGGDDAVLYDIREYAPLDKSAMDDAAVWLARARIPVPGQHLDPDATARASARTGGRIELIFEPHRASRTILVFVDVEKRDHPMLACVTHVLDHWHRIGIDVVRYDYRFRPTIVWPHGQLDRPRHLASLARSTAESPLIVFSRIAAPTSLRGEVHWPEALTPWSARVLVDLDPRPPAARDSQWRDAVAACRTARLERYPFTDNGLVAACRSLTRGHTQTVDESAWPDTITSPMLRALETWATVASYVPDATWAQLESIRREFTEVGSILDQRGHVQLLIDWVRPHHHAQGTDPEGAHGDRLDIPLRLRTRLMAAERQRHELARDQYQRALRRWRKARSGPEPTPPRGLEERARGFLISQLERVNQRHGFESEMRRQHRRLKIAFHRAIVDPDKAYALEAFVRTPVKKYLVRLLQQERALQEQHRVAFAPWPRAVWETVTAWMDNQDKIPARELLTLRPQVSRSRLVRGLVWACALGMVAAFLAWTTVVTSPARNTVAGQTSRLLPERLQISGERARLDFEPDVRWIGGDTFTMGSQEGDERADGDEFPAHRVEVSGFYMCRTEVTQAQWRAVMGQNPSDCDGKACGENFPVNQVTWLDAVEYLDRLTEAVNQTLPPGQRMTPCYGDRQGESVSWDQGCTGYRLPTEAEWEYAARAESRTAYHFGDDATELGEYAWYRENSGVRVHEVGTRKPNGWQLHDMHGNVWEWVWDWYGPYESGDASNPEGPTSGTGRVLRGGSAWYGARYLRSANRVRNRPGYRNWDMGFRCARGAPQR